MNATEDYLRYLRSGTIAESSVTTRRNHLRALERVFPDLLAVTEPDLVEYLASRPYAAETRRSHRTTIRGFYAWAARTGLMPANPAIDLRTIRQVSRIPKPIPEVALADALARADDEQRLMLLLGAYAGLRRAEIAAVHSDDITDTTLTVRGKGDKVRTIPIHSRLRPHLREVRGYAFPGRFGGHREVSYIGEHLAPILAPWTPHSLRHRFATQTYRACKDLTVVQQLLGHASIQTTLLYVLVDNDSLASAVESIA